MFLALREMRHSKARYSLIIVIMLLVSFLVLFVTGLARGLAYANISAVENMPANYYAVQKDADHAFRRSQLSAAELSAARSIAGEQNAASLAVQMSTITADQADAKADVTFFAVDMNGMLAPKVTQGTGITNETQGSVVADSKLEESGVTIGSTIKDQASGLTFKVAGFVDDNSYSHTPVVYINTLDWKAMRQGFGQSGKDAEAVPYNVIALKISSAQVSDITEKLGNVEVITQKQAIASIPGYSAEQNSLLMMIVFLFVIAAFVLAVFFYVITIQKTSQFGILKAMGTKMSYLAWSVVGQVLILSVASLAVSLLLTFGMNMGLPDSMPFQLEGQTILLTCMLFVGMSLLGSLISVARVARVDALEAIGRAGA
ncbi:ABC transporter permease [Paenibacillus jilunlii]|uniref:Putative hemin transport system permease protein HrtB n=1 Tax=Paenibacillus jilunlii TaxID=682956 RepID=A0A1G9HLV1_9BACL|nr:ABC transporter permease [Paenibacillus jilunlii]KWX69721.1 ABC transporter permease [Paenibacillus jilunlii]SDL13855.1 putative ABC transport system permease protein [Paenibacillus jilunlii]